MKRSILFCPLLVGLLFTRMSTAFGNIGGTLGTAQETYGSRGTYTSDGRGVTWHFRGLLIAEYYDSKGYCDRIIYYAQPGKTFSQSGILELLQINTPSGVLWKQNTNETSAIGSRWYSTDFVKDEVIADSLVATLFTNVANRSSLSITTAVQKDDELSRRLRISEP
jgi:hypothetical protein